MASGSFEFTPSGALQGKIYWSSTSNGSSANSSNVTAILYARRTDSYTTWARDWSGYVKVGSAQVNVNFSSTVYVSSDWVEMARVTTTIAHNNDGTGSASVSGSVTGPSGTSLEGKTSSGSQIVTLDRIPRYTSISTFSVSKRNETSFTINWATADTVDYVYYSTNNGSSWTGVDVTDGTSGSFNISGLNPNTTYNCKIRVRRKDSQLTTDSSTVSQTTYKAPAQSLSSKTETSITMSWSCDTTANHIWYSKDNGSTWVDVGNVNATSGTYTIPNLTVNTSYNIKTRVRRSATNTTYDSAMSTQTTCDYPYCTNSPNFTIGDPVTLSFYNPLGRTFQFYIIANDTQIVDSWEISGTSYTGINAVSTQNQLYATIPNLQEATYKIKVVYGTSTKIRDNGNTYSVIGTEVPTFSNFAYKDSNTTVSSVTGDDQVMVKGLSTVQVTVSSANKMVANNSATPNYYKASISNLSANGNYSTSDVVINLGTINDTGTQRLNVEAYDSRGLKKLIYKDVTVYDYIKPVVNATLTRLNDFESETTLKVNGTYTKLAINNVNKNSIINVKYRYRETNGTWSGWTNITTTNNNGNFTCNDVVLALDNTKSFEFEIQATDSLQQATTISGNVDVGQAIFFISTNNRTAYVNGNEVVSNNYTGDTNQTGNATITGNTTTNGTATVNGNANVTDYISTNKGIKIPKNGGAGYGLTNSDGASIIRDHNNQNVTVDATGGTLYLGYQNTTGINILNGKASVNNSGVVKSAGIDFRNNNSANIEWKENGAGDKFRLIPDFSGSDDTNKFKVQGTVGGSGTDPTTWKDLLTLSGKTGNLVIGGTFKSTGMSIVDGGNSWKKIDIGFCRVYFKSFSFTNAYPGNGWGWLSNTGFNLPTGITFDNTKMAFFGNAVCVDTAISHNVGLNNGGTSINVSYTNKYGGDIGSVYTRYNFTLIDFS